jgi:hypothetical protein
MKLQKGPRGRSGQSRLAALAYLHLDSIWMVRQPMALQLAEMSNPSPKRANHPDYFNVNIR